MPNQQVIRNWLLKGRIKLIERLACKLGRRDEQPDVELAEYLCEHEDHAGIKEIVAGLKDSDKRVVNDCIKVLYEIGYRKPELIAEYYDVFIEHLLSPNNRLVWGSMIALGTIAHLKPHEIYPHFRKIKHAYENGSVITVDHSITVFAKLSRADKKYEKEIFPIIIQHLGQCRPKEVPQYAERAMICIDATNVEEFIAVLEKRKPQLSPPQFKRVNKVIQQVARLREDMN